MLVGHDSRPLTFEEMNKILLSPHYRNARLKHKTWAALNRTKFDPVFLQDFDTMFLTPDRAKIMLVAMITAKEPMPCQQTSRVSDYLMDSEGRDADGHYLYCIGMGPHQAVKLSHDDRVLRVDDIQAYYAAATQAALPKIDKARVPDEIPTNRYNNKDGIIFTAKAPLPELKDLMAYDAYLENFKKDDDGNLVFRLSKFSLWNLAYLSTHPSVLEIIDQPTFWARNKLNEDKLPDYKAPKQLAATFADCAYPKGWERIKDRALHWATGWSDFDDQAVIDLQVIVRKSFMSFIDSAFYRSSRGIPTVIGNDEKRFLAEDIQRNLPNLDYDWYKSYDLKGKFAKYMVNDVLAQLSADQPVLTTQSGENTFQLLNDNGVISLLKLKKTYGPGIPTPL